jgi:hypothetical protein
MQARSPSQQGNELRRVTVHATLSALRACELGNETHYMVSTRHLLRGVERAQTRYDHVSCPSRHRNVAKWKRTRVFGLHNNSLAPETKVS